MLVKLAKPRSLLPSAGCPVPLPCLGQSRRPLGCRLRKGQAKGAIRVVGHTDWIECLPCVCQTAYQGPNPSDRKSTRLNSSHANISYAVFCLKKKNKHT